ncbi:MAG: DUF4199 domain-containing protein [Bacteroidota bacterium]
MRKNILTFGLLSGAIITAMMVITSLYFYNNPDYQGSMILGFGTMLLAFSMIFVAIKNYRDKFNNGVITFGKGFTIGLYIALIASSIYVLVWLIEFYCFIPDFMDKYSAHMLKTAEAKGSSAAELAKEVADINSMKGLYKNPIFVILLTYVEVLPLATLVAIISALILKRKTPPQNISDIPAV